MDTTEHRADLAVAAHRRWVALADRTGWMRDDARWAPMPLAPALGWPTVARRTVRAAVVACARRRVAARGVPG